MDDSIRQTIPPTAAALAEAIQAGDFDAADQLVQTMGKAVPAEALPDAAEVHLHRRRWSDAARLLGRVIDPDDRVHMRRCFARNMAAAERHRPEVYEQLIAAEPGAFRTAATPAGPLTIINEPPGSAPVVLSPRNDPFNAVTQAMKQLATPLAEGQPIGICGLGDGYMLSALAAHDESLPLGRQQLIHVFVDDPTHLLAAFEIHDYSRPAGPLAQPRFCWHVGPGWPERLTDRIIAEPTLPLPAVKMSQGPQGAAAEQQLAQVSDRLAERMSELKSRVADHADSLMSQQLADVLGETPSRPPRALLITSRFTTVLQHSIRDTAAGLHQLGWETELLIEPDDRSQVTAMAILDAIDRHRPDLVFVIDHVRSEYGNLFPKQLPFVCWIQDHLPNLTRREAGASIGARDFILTMVRPMYEQWGYPTRQMIPVPKLTRVPARPATWACDGDDLVYVSNASQNPDDLIQDAIITAGEGPLRQLVEHCCRELTQIYAGGGCVSTLWELGRLLDNAQQATGIGVTDPAVRSRLIYLLNHPLNNALYRQQALNWVADVAEQLDLAFALYGHGWDKHARFRRYARGPVAYGPDLEELTRRSRINLQIVPSFCLHQRMLDGLVAGGFFLVRSNPADVSLPELAAFLDQHAPEARHVEEARRMIPADRQAAFDDLLLRAAWMQELGHAIDPVAWTHDCRIAELLDGSGTALPHLEDVSFRDAASLKAAVQRFIDDDQARRTIADAQRCSVEQRLSYAAGMQRAMHRIGKLVAQEQRA